MSWPMVKLGDVVSNCNFRRVPLKKADRAERQGDYRYYGASGVIDYIDDFIFDGEYLLIGEDGANLLSRSTPIAFHASGKFWVNNHAHILECNGKADLGFLAYYINSINLEPYITGSAQPKLNRGNLDSILIPLPPLEEQKRIAAILDKADVVRQKRKQAIDLADEFLRSVFLDMFGEPTNNQKDFPIGTIRDLVETANYGSSGKASETEGEFPMLRMGNITYQGGWNFTNLKYIDLSEKDKPKYLTQKGDLLFNRTNSRELVGKTAVFEEDKPMAIAGYLVRVRPNKKGNNYYISGYLNSAHGKQVLSTMCKSIVGMANINAQELQNIKIALPPIELQIKYELLVKAVRSRVKNFDLSTQSTNELFNSLSQKAFSGQL